MSKTDLVCSNSSIMTNKFKEEILSDYIYIYSVFRKTSNFLSHFLFANKHCKPQNNHKDLATTAVSIITETNYN